MVARLWAEWIVNKRRTYSQVPPKLKESVKKILIEWNYPEFVK